MRTFIEWIEPADWQSHPADPIIVHRCSVEDAVTAQRQEWNTPGMDATKALDFFLARHGAKVITE